MRGATAPLGLRHALPTSWLTVRIGAPIAGFKTIVSCASQDGQSQFENDSSPRDIGGGDSPGELP